MAVRKRMVFGVAAGALAAAGVVVAVVAIGGGGPGGRVNAAAIGFGPAQVSRLERGLTAPALGRQAVVVAPQIRAQFVRRGQSLLPPGSGVRVEPATFHLTRAGFAVVQAVLNGPEAGRWQLILIRSRGDWLLIGTRRIP